MKVKSGSVKSKNSLALSSFLSYDVKCLVSLPAVEVKVMPGPVIVPISENSLVMVCQVST